LTQPRGGWKVIFAITSTTHPQPADQRVATDDPGRSKMPLLARLGVGSKLILLVLLPVGLLLGFTISGAVGDWRKASSRGDFRSATEQSFAEDRLATAVTDEGAATALARLQPSRATAVQLRAARAATDATFRQAAARAAAWDQSLDLSGRLDAAQRELNSVRVQAAGDSLTVRQTTDAYSAIVGSLLSTVRQLDTAAPTRRSSEAADAYVAIGTAISAAARERNDVARLIATRPSVAVAAVRGRTLEAAELDAFRENAAGSLPTDLNAVLYSPAGITVSTIRDSLDRDALKTVRTVPLEKWMRASSSRIQSLRGLQAGARENLAAATSNDVGAARARGFRDLGISIVVLLLVTGLALALRRSITRPLGEVSDGARNLSSGDLGFDVAYRGRDEIGHVASAFRRLQETVEHVAGEIRGMTAAVRDNRLDHRADVAAFEGTWSQLLAGLNGTMTAFSELESRRERAERELSDFFELSVDLLCIANFDGYFTHVNPAAERTLGYTNAELVSRPFMEFVHPDDRANSSEVFNTLTLGQDVIQFENRCLCADGSVRWIQWSTRTIPAEGLVYAVGRDVTDRRRSQEEQAALHRIATLVAEGASPAETFSAVATEVGQLVDGEVAAVFRYEPEQAATAVGGWSVPGIEVPIGSRLRVVGDGIVMRVLNARHAARVDRFEGPPGSIAGFFQSLDARCGIGAPITVDGQLWGVLVVVSTEPDRFPAGSELAVAEFTELLATAIANAETRAELTASRARVVATADETRRRIERDLHDGAQQRLVSLAFKLRAAQSAVPPELDDVSAELDQVAAGLAGALDELREFARGIHPAILAEGGLGPALRALARRSEVPVELDVRTTRRLPAPMEVAAYYVVSEALTNTAKHADASAVFVDVEEAEGALRISVRDDGVGGADFAGGSGLVGLKDRVESLGGRVSVQSPRGVGTSIQVELPLADLDRVGDRELIARS
jgi:PAS domain S-box-containing protein